MESIQIDAKLFEKSPIENKLPSYTSSLSLSGNDSESEKHQFVERKHLLIDGSFEYCRNGEEPGLVLIFNQEKFCDKSQRFGSRRDVNEIILCFSRLGFNINKNNIFNDLTSEQLSTTIDEITSKKLFQMNCLILFFLTHGDSFNILQTSDGSLTTNTIWQKFQNCDYLKNKPKMFVFQACKGNEHSTISDHNKQKIKLVPENTFQTGYIGPDMLIVYSTTEGNVSFRNRFSGSWLVQELCKNFTAYGRRDDVVSLVIRTTKCVCKNYYHYKREDCIQKQMPTFVSTLRRKFYLNRSKDRNFLIHMEKQYHALIEDVTELQIKVDFLYEVYDEKRNKRQNMKKRV